MAVKIRLRQQGRTNRQTYRLVVTDIRRPRDGKYLEMIGTYNPFASENNIKFDAERLNYWMDKGAQLSENAEQLLRTVAPEVIKGLRAKVAARRLKNAAKRRNLKKKA